MKNKNKQVKIMDDKTETKQFMLSEQTNNNNGVQNGDQKQNGSSKNGVNTKPPLPKDEKTEKILADKKNKENSDLKILKKGKTLCQACKKKCSGEVLRVQEKYFHTDCFKCGVCARSLAQGGFFSRDGKYFCTQDYQRNFGTKCAQCQDYVEGEVVTALGKTYHQRCFTCGRCRQPFPSGEKVTYTGKEVLCQKCVAIPVRESGPNSPTAPALQSPTGGSGDNVHSYVCLSYPLQNSNLNIPSTNGKIFADCAGCSEQLKEGQALIALERQWHVWCFKCGACGQVLHGEYMGRDGIPYCERDYQRQFGVKCAYCQRYISGKVLQAGDNHHFHPTCARCTKCGDPFGDGEEMYLQGGAIWHPRCGPGPTENGTILNGTAETNGHCTDTESRGYTSGREFDRMSSSGVSELQFSLRSRTPSLSGSLYSPPSRRSRKHSYRTPSPGLILREYNKSAHEDISRILTYSYLTEEPSLGYLRRPIDPYDKTPISPHFHRPTSQHSLRSSTPRSFSKKSGMRVMAESIRSETPRSKSPHMNNEEPIELAHFPDAKKPKPGQQCKIERDDFPAPPYPYTDPERRRRWSDTYKGVPESESDEEVDGTLSPQEIQDLQLKKEEQELSKIATGIGKVFLKNVKEREKIKKWKAAHLDPRNASRTPSANKEPPHRLRYDSPIGASPSRNTDHPKPFEDDDTTYSVTGDRSVSCRSVSVTRTQPTGAGYNVISSLRNVPRPGYGLQSATLPIAARNGNGYLADYSFSGLGDKTHSTDFSSGKSDISTGSNTDGERRAMNNEPPMPVSTTYTGGLGYGGAYVTHMRRSLPNMAHSALINEPAKIYPYHLLLITNYRLPHDVDRCNLERHLSDAEFEAIFQCQRADFYRLPQWRRSELKRRARLF